MSLAFRTLVLLEVKKSVRFRGVRMSRAQRREGAVHGVYSERGRGHRSIVALDRGARLAPGQRGAIGRRLNRLRSGVNRTALANARRLAKRRGQRQHIHAAFQGSLIKPGRVRPRRHIGPGGLPVLPRRPYTRSFRGGSGDLRAATRMRRRGGRRR